MNKIPEEIRNQVIALKKEGKTYQEIVTITGVSKRSISNICKSVGLGNTFIELTPEKIQECQELYDELGNIKKVAKQTGISYQRLRNVIQSKSITPKSSYEYLKQNRRKIKEELVAYKGGKCERCGYNNKTQKFECYECAKKERKDSYKFYNAYVFVQSREIFSCQLC